MRQRFRLLVQNLPWLAPAAYAVTIETRMLGYPGAQGLALFAVALVLVLLAARSPKAGLARYARYGALLAAALVSPASRFGGTVAQLALALAAYGWVNELDQLRGLGGIARASLPMPKVIPRVVFLMIAAATLVDHSVLLSFIIGGATTFTLSLLLLQTRATHRLELGVSPRPELAIGLLSVAFLVACAAAPAMSFVWVFRLATFAVSPLIFVLVTTTEYARSARWIRRVLAVLALASIVALGTSLLLGAYPARGATVAFAIALVGVAVGALSGEAERVMTPDGGRLRDRVERASEQLASHEPELALVKMLDMLSYDARQASLFTMSPATTETVDRAGYLHARPLVLPQDVIAIALSEPLGTVRHDVLEANEVRRPELRSALHWLDEHHLQSLTLAIADGVVVGALGLPAEKRPRSLFLEEVLVVRALTDALVLLLESRASTARLLADRRQRDEALSTAEGVIEQKEHALSLEAGRHQAATHRLARPSAVGLYSPAQRLAYEAIERRVSNGATVIVATDGTLDPIPYLARAHLTGARKHAALVVVDCTLSREHAALRWKSADASPFVLASGGLLVLSDAFCLPLDVQELVARVHLERRAPWERPDVLDLQIAITYCGELALWKSRGAVHALFDSRFHLEDVSHAYLPSLSERAEDLRAVLADALAREGMRLGGEPLGIETAAVARFFEHPFEGGDVELAFIVQVLARNVTGRAVTKEDVDRVLHQQRWLVANDVVSVPRGIRS